METVFVFLWLAIFPIKAINGESQADITLIK